MKKAEIQAQARLPYVRYQKQLENEIRLLRALAKALGASEEALAETRYVKTEETA